METKYGAKYDASLTIVQIAKCVRADIKAAIKAGELPEGTYSVRVDKYAGGRSLHVEVKELPFNIINLDWAVNGDPCGRSGTDYRYNAEGRQVLKHLEALRNAYNYDGSDTQTDYFHVNYYGGTRFAREIDGWVVESVCALKKPEAERSAYEKDVLTRFNATDLGRKLQHLLTNATGVATL